MQATLYRGDRLAAPFVIDDGAEIITTAIMVVLVFGVLSKVQVKCEIKRTLLWSAVETVSRVRYLFRWKEVNLKVVRNMVRFTTDFDFAPK